MSETSETSEPVLNPLDLYERMGEQWAVFRTHSPRGQNYPVGQLDGDCACGQGPWPCQSIRNALGEDALIVSKRDLAAIIGPTWAALKLAIQPALELVRKAGLV